MARLHNRYDVTHWSKIFPLDNLKGFLYGPTLAGPGEIAVVEQLKQSAKRQQRPVGESLPIDLCVWNWGELPRREMTCVGGLPYRPAGAPWPTGDRGAPLTFVAQFCFRDSRDLFPSLPGDVLLIFGPGPDDFHDLHFEWRKLGMDALITSDDVPETGWRIQPGFASLLRTEEFPEADRDIFGATYPLNAWSRGGAGSKIGGFVEEYDYSIHLDDGVSDDVEPSEQHAWAIQMIERQHTRGALLCRLESICPGSRWPFINRAEANWRFYSDVDLLSIYDAGAIALYLNDQGELTHDISSG